MSKFQRSNTFNVGVLNCKLEKKSVFYFSVLKNCMIFVQIYPVVCKSRDCNMDIEQGGRW